MKKWILTILWNSFDRKVGKWKMNSAIYIFAVTFSITCICYALGTTTFSCYTSKTFVWVFNNSTNGRCIILTYTGYANPFLLLYSVAWLGAVSNMWDNCLFLKFTGLWNVLPYLSVCRSGHRDPKVYSLLGGGFLTQSIG